MGAMGGFGSGFSNYGTMGSGVGLWLNIAILIGIVFLVIWAVKQFSRGGASITPSSPSATITQPQSAREILAKRYARGELTRDEYLATLNDISGGE